MVMDRQCYGVLWQEYDTGCCRRGKTTLLGSSNESRHPAETSRLLPTEKSGTGEQTAARGPRSLSARRAEYRRGGLARSCQVGERRGAPAVALVREWARESVDTER